MKKRYILILFLIIISLIIISFKVFNTYYNNIGFAPKQIILIRHGEKENSDGSIEDVNLSQNGYIRANELPNFFENYLPNPINKPDTIIAMKQKDSEHSNRPVETVEPLSKSLNLGIISNYTQDETDNVVNYINNNDKNKVVLVCWEHDYLVKIAKKLGAPVKNWGENPNSKKDNNDDYDSIWVITKINDKEAKLQVFKEFSVSKEGKISYEQVSNNPIFEVSFNLN